MLKQQLISRYYELMEQLENKYMNHIFELLEQKKCITSIIQKQFSHQIEIIDSLNSVQLNHSMTNQQNVDIHESRGMMQTEQCAPSQHKGKMEHCNKPQSMSEYNHMSIEFGDIAIINTCVNELKPHKKQLKNVSKKKSKKKSKQLMVITNSLANGVEGSGNTAHPQTSIVKKQSSRKSNEQSVEENDGQLKCTQCDKTFATKGNLQIHLLIHSGEKPYKCDYCDKAFTTKFNKVRHERLHTGERPFKCKYCNLGFYRNDERQLHEEMHFGPKPFDCVKCGKRFTRSYNRNKHSKKCKGI